MEIYVEIGTKDAKQRIRLGRLGTIAFETRCKVLHMLPDARRPISVRRIRKLDFDVDGKDREFDSPLESRISAALLFLRKSGLAEQIPERNYAITKAGREARRSLDRQVMRGWSVTSAKPSAVRGYLKSDRVSVWVDRKAAGEFVLYVDLREHLASATTLEKRRVKEVVAGLALTLERQQLAARRAVDWNGLRLCLYWRSGRPGCTTPGRSGLLVAHDIAELLEDRLEASLPKLGSTET